MYKALFAVAAWGASGWACAAGTLPGGTFSISQTHMQTMVGGAASAGTVSGGPAASASTIVSSGVTASMTGIETYSISDTRSVAEAAVSSSGAGSGSMGATASGEHHGLAESDGDGVGTASVSALGFGGFGTW